MDLSNRRLSSTDNVRYVSENNLQQILLSLVEYQQKAQETIKNENEHRSDEDLKYYNNLKKKQLLIETLSLIITWLNF